MAQNTTVDIVVGRSRVDNYLLGVCGSGRNNCSLIDGTFSIKSLHNGYATYANRSDMSAAGSLRWNDMVIYRLSLPKGSLCRNTTLLVLNDTGSLSLIKRSDWMETVSYVRMVARYTSTRCPLRK